MKLTLGYLLVAFALVFGLGETPRGPSLADADKNSVRPTAPLVAPAKSSDAAVLEAPRSVPAV